MEKNLSLVLSVAFVALLIFSASYFSKNSSGITKNEGTAYIGARVNKVSFYDLSGKKVDFSDFKGKKVMVWLFATWCPSCIAGMQELERNNAKLQNLKIIALKTYANAGYPGPILKALLNNTAKAFLGVQIGALVLLLRRTPCFLTQKIILTYIFWLMMG